MDSIACFWLNRQRTICTKPILKRAENTTLWPNGCKNQRGETIAPGIVAPKFQRFSVWHIVASSRFNLSMPCLSHRVRP
jgi:hypothetical protein